MFFHNQIKEVLCSPTIYGAPKTRLFSERIYGERAKRTEPSNRNIFVHWGRKDGESTTALRTAYAGSSKGSK